MWRKSSTFALAKWAYIRYCAINKPLIHIFLLPMDFSWLTSLLGPGNESLASTIVLYSFVIAFGVFLGKIKVAGVSLGVTFVLFVGILMGHLGKG